MKPYYAIKSLYPPIVIEVPSGRYAVSGSVWIPVTEDVTAEMVEAVWEPLYSRDTAEHQTRKFEIASSRTTERYTVTEKGGKWSCNCPGFEYHKKCRHVEQAKNESQRHFARQKGSQENLRVAVLFDRYPVVFFELNTLCIDYLHTWQFSKQTACWHVFVKTLLDFSP